MIRALRIVAAIVIFASGMPRSSAQSPATASSSPDPVEEAAQLNQVMVKLYGEGKYREVIAPAEQALALRQAAPTAAAELCASVLLGCLHPGRRLAPARHDCLSAAEV
jgi:hypothetical protein